MNGAHIAGRSWMRVLRSRKPEEPDAAAVPQLLPEDIEQDAGIDPAAPRCSMHFKAAGGEWVRCCGQERLFRLPMRGRGQKPRSKTMPFDDDTGGERTTILAAPTKLREALPRDADRVGPQRLLPGPTYRAPWDQHALLSAILQPTPTPWWQHHTPAALLRHMCPVRWCIRCNRARGRCAGCSL